MFKKVFYIILSVSITALAYYCHLNIGYFSGSDMVLTYIPVAVKEFVLEMLLLTCILVLINYLAYRYKTATSEAGKIDKWVVGSSVVILIFVFLVKFGISFFVLLCLGTPEALFSQ